MVEDLGLYGEGDYFIMSEFNDEEDVKIVLYGTHCPKCIVLEKKLILSDIRFEMISDEDKVKEFADKHNLKFIPILVVDDKVLDFTQAINWVNHVRG